MNKFFSAIGRVGNVALHLLAFGAQAYALSTNSGKPNWANVAITAVQLYAADQGLKANPPAPKP